MRFVSVSYWFIFWLRTECDISLSTSSSFAFRIDRLVIFRGISTVVAKGVLCALYANGFCAATAVAVCLDDDRR